MSGGRPLEAHILGGPPAPVKLRAGRVQGVRLRAVCQEVSNGRRSGPPGVPVGYSVPGFLSSLSLWRVASFCRLRSPVRKSSGAPPAPPPLSVTLLPLASGWAARSSRAGERHILAPSPSFQSETFGRAFLNLFPFSSIPNGTPVTSNT